MNFSVFLLVYAFSVIRPPTTSSRTAEHQHRSHRYEAKRQEIEAWLMRMESRSERMGNAEAQADVLDFGMLDSQQKEQKVRVSARFSSNFTVVRHDFSSAVFMLAAFFSLGHLEFMSPFAHEIFMSRRFFVPFNHLPLDFRTSTPNCTPTSTTSSCSIN